MKTHITFLLAIILFCSVTIAQETPANEGAAVYLNPESFVRFVERGYTYSSVKNQNAIGHSIKPKSILKIMFVEVPEEYRKKIEIRISAYIKTLDNNIIPLDVPGFTFVSANNASTLSPENTSANETVKHDVQYSTKRYDQLVNTEINLSELDKLKEGDELVIKVVNVAFNSVSHTMVFVIDDFGWKGEIATGPVWVKTYNSERINFATSPFAGYSFHYQHRKNDSFWKKFLTPSFGPAAVLVGDGTNTMSFGLGMQLSVMARTVTFGSGYFLNESGDRKHREYYYLGVNFLEGIDAFKGILGR